MEGGKRTERELATEGGYGDYLDKAIHGWIFMPCRGSLFGFKSQKKDSILKVRTNAGVSHWTLLHLIPAGDQYNSRGQAQRRPPVAVVVNHPTLKGSDKEELQKDTQHGTNPR